jgi:hypothetical protein
MGNLIQEDGENMFRATRRDIAKGGVLAGLAEMLGSGSQLTAIPARSTPDTSQQQPHWEAPPKQQGNNLNLIVLVSDSFRADNLEAYGSQWVETSNLNQFARESIICIRFMPMFSMSSKGTSW